MASKVSFHIGKKFSIKHNRREFDREKWNLDHHIDPAGKHIELIDRDLRDFISEHFSEPLEKYNEKVRVKNPGRMKSIEEICEQGKESAREIIVQLGNMQNNPLKNKEHEDMLTQYVYQFKTQYPNLLVFGAYIHLDESTPHLHLDILPVAKDCKRGMSEQISMSGALTQMGYKRTGKYSERQDVTWLNDARNFTEKFMGQYAEIKPHEKATEKHLEYWQYKEKKAKQYTMNNANQKLEQVKQRMREREVAHELGHDRDIERNIHQSHGMHR